MSAWIHNGQIRENGAIPSCDGIDIGAEDGDNIAIVLFDKENHTRAEVVARANLICAAQELLVELQNIANADIANFKIDETDTRADCFAQFYAWARNRARAAIAKITKEKS